MFDRDSSYGCGVRLRILVTLVNACGCSHCAVLDGPAPVDELASPNRFVLVGRW